MDSHEIEYTSKVLAIIRQNGGTVEYTKLLSMSPLSGGDTKSLLIKLKQDGYISGEFRSSSRVYLTDAGRLFLLKLEAYDKQERDRCANEDAEKRANDAKADADRKKASLHEYLVVVFTAVVSALLTLFVEHFGEIVDFILSLFA